ncbi:DUF6443 domain-containing protein [Mucilaginibacter sp. cycad4]|uniref:DUF6443 domain-containing protein n=1 Tax=Mucilaginibacter sp. cycad4 TaxID=3342096 RepID=UPI002AAB2CC5|nr:DUF6443 domain-containing protein [Mucilaginibacter gossypii]WPU98892.1 DUF6443 domain-containing protein [Mucilaginibacter gossypii]
MISLKFYRNLCLVMLIAAFNSSSYGQTVTRVIDANVSSYQGTSYEAYHSVTLSPGFSFTPNTTYTAFYVNIAAQDQKPDDQSLLINNTVRQDMVKVSGVTLPTQIQPGVNAQTIVSYLDGLGRPIQRISMQGSPLHKDMVQLMAYDQYGRQPLQYLPYTATTGNGSLQVNAIAAQNAFYQVTGQQIATDNAPFAGTVYDNSPLQRVLETGAPGAAWQTGTGHSLKTASRLNTAADNIRIWNSAGPTGTYYGAGQLSVSDITDENGNHVLTFSNKLGQLVSKKVQAGSNSWLESIIICDDLGNVLYQVSPEGVKRIYGASPPAFNAAFINAWTTSYTYDAKGRLVAKQAPGAGPEYMVYDSNNRLVLTQDGRLRSAYATDTWYYVKYDAANRTIMSGLYRYSAPPGATGSTNQQILQNYLDGLTYDNVSTFASEKRQAGTTYGFSNRSFPSNIVDADVLQVNYYDDYDFNNTGTPVNQYVNPNASGFATTAVADNSSLLTGTMSRVITTAGNAGGWIKQAIFYDQFGNPIQKQTNNLVNQSALDITSNAIDLYSGHITQTKQVKSLSATTVIHKVSYDIMDRITQVAANINAGATDQVIAKYEYNELGQLKDKKLGLVTGSTYLQTVDYRYNIRGWLTSINNSTLTPDGGLTNSDTNDLFGISILYNQADATGLSNTPKYNGKISEIKWKANDQFSSSTNPVRERSYTFTYDAADRLTNAQYVANSGSAWNAETGGYNETIGGYDNNGNILSLTRNTYASGASAFTLLDNLSYTYKNSNVSNQLASVADLSSNAMGYNGTINSAVQYSYDNNGNLTTDVNKGETITYNDLNKVSKVLTGTGSVEYTYDASGNRIRKVLYNSSHVALNTYDYLDGFVYTTVGAGSRTLTYFNTAEGRVLSNTTATAFTYEYFIKDHLGNTRVSFRDNGSGAAAITQENEYYPFGMTMQGIAVRTAQSTTANKQLFNGGSELQDDLGFENSYSTPEREYDPQIGRFNSIDPMVDSYAGWTPYNFTFNDPVGMNDPSGAAPGGIGPNPGFAPDVWAQIEAQWNTTNYGNQSHSGSDTNGQIVQAQIYNTSPGQDQYGNTGMYVVTGAFYSTDSKGNSIPINDVSGAFSQDFIKIKEPPSENKAASVGQPGTLESLIPVWGNGRAAVDDFQNGNYWTGAFHTALAISDVFLVKAVVTSIAKVAVKAVVTSTLENLTKEAAATAVLSTRQAAAVATGKVSLEMMRGNAVDAAVKEAASNKFLLNKLVDITPRFTFGPDFVGKGLLKGVWWDVTTAGSWEGHVTKYVGFGEGVPVLYK